MKLDNIINIIELRQAVAYLGEKKVWWKTSFFDPNSKEFLKYIFPKSTNSQYTCSLITTRNHNDNQVGANYYHLFRLPLSLEELINSKDISLRNLEIESEEDALNVLGKIAGNLMTDETGGPKNIGSIDQLNSEIIQAFAAEYLNAFKNNYTVYPYLN